MKKSLYLIIPFTLLGATLLPFSKTEPSKAESCVPLQVVGASGTSVQKNVSAPGVPPISRNNWNTDFSVPASPSFRTFKAVIQSESTSPADFPVEMNLKYSDGTDGRTFQGNVQLEPSQSRTLIGNPRQGEQPFQVNLKIGSVGTLGFSYKLTVLGCR